MADSKDDSLGARMLIMLYGLGIVLLGAYPLQKEHGSLTNFIKKKWESLEIPNPLAGLSLEELERRNAKQRAIQEAEEEEADRISSTDRKALNTLLEKLE